MTDQPPSPTVFEEPARFDLSSFACPRCSTLMSADAYGPCPSCVAELSANQRSEASGDGAGGTGNTAYEPKMNVTPNAVALKDD